MSRQLGDHLSVQAWQWTGAIFFAYLLAVAALPRGAGRAARIRVVLGAAAGLAAIGVSTRLPAEHIANTLILPATALLVGYWTSGCLFVSPMPRAERLLAGIDRALDVDRLAAACPRAVAECLEFAYTFVYLLVPIALYLSLSEGISADRFWTTILLTDYVCFGMLPWIQTRPPRALGFDATWRSAWRRVNVRLLDASSVQVNTFPSGHAAEALAVALLLSGAAGPVAAVLFVVGAAISAGAVFGRYHYAADAIAGWIVAVIVYLACRTGL